MRSVTGCARGLFVKPLTSKYLPNYRAWTKVPRRATTEAITGAITGTLTRPQLLVLGRHDDAGRLRAVGRTVPLRPEQARLVAEHLAAADPGQPWTGVRFAAAWRSRDALDAVLVRPDGVAGIGAYRSVDGGGVFRHPLRFQRLRLDVGLEDVPGFGEEPAALFRVQFGVRDGLDVQARRLAVHMRHTHTTDA